METKYTVIGRNGTDPNRILKPVPALDLSHFRHTKAASERGFNRCGLGKASADTVCGVARVAKGPTTGPNHPEICVQIAVGCAQVDADLIKDAAYLIKSASDSTQVDARCSSSPRLHTKPWGFDAVAGGLDLDFGGLRSIRGVAGRVGSGADQGRGGLRAGCSALRAGRYRLRAGVRAVRGGAGGLDADCDRGGRCGSGTGCDGIRRRWLRCGIGIDRIEVGERLPSTGTLPSNRSAIAPLGLFAGRACEQPCTRGQKKTGSESTGTTLSHSALFAF